jgi:hypothetical protein
VANIAATRTVGGYVTVPVIQGRVQQLWQVTITRHDDGKAIAQGKVRLQNVPLAQPE